MSTNLLELPAPLPGVRLFEPPVFTDVRGSFVKTYHENALAEKGISFTMKEEYFSISKRGVVRGMHFQIPPADHTKVVYCARGSVKDVVLDLRTTSPSYGKSAACILSDKNRRIFFIPPGFAHGFLSLEDESLMVYKTSSEHSPKHDAGIRWDSFGFNWDAVDPIISARDVALPPLAAFISPFKKLS